MTKQPKLYPGHRHQWADHPRNQHQVVCTVCGFDPPRNVAKLDGEAASKNPTNPSPSRRP